MIGQDVLYWIWLANKCGVASKYFDRLIFKYDDPFDIYNLDENEIQQLENVSDKLKEKLCEKDLEEAYDIIKYCKKNGVDIVTYKDKRYPERLRLMTDPPIVLYCKGWFPNFNDLLCVGVVGTRKMSEYGKQSSYKIAYELAGAGALIVSGMALGIDGVAACAALSAGGRTVAVLGCGIDTVYPKQHKALMEQIVRHGAVITEYPPFEPPHGYNFPKRNRIISGLCQGVVIAEASVGSGALITARTAIDQGKQVFAIPGKINDAGAEGPNSLIREGAYPVLCGEDVFKQYEFLYSDAIDKKGYEKAKARIPNPDIALKKYGLEYAIGSKTAKIEAQEKKAEKTDNIKNIKNEKKSEDVSANVEQKSEISSEVMGLLDDITKRIFKSLPYDRSVTLDELVDEGVEVSTVITSLTMLELYGLVTSLPGGLYIRK